MNQEDGYIIGEQVAYLYKGALKVLGDRKQAEKIVFLFFSAILFGKDNINDTISLILNQFGKNK